MSRRFWVIFTVVWAGAFMGGYYIGLHLAGAR